MKIVFLNGPPRCGKDHAARLLEQYAGATIASFAQEVKERCHAAHDLYVANKCWPLQHDHFEALKDTALDAFLGRTPREAYIAFSERFMKPLHGEGVFGRLLAERLEGPIELLAIPDSGFREEAAVLMQELEVDPAGCLLVRIHRDGHDFAKDSRSYLDLSDLGVDCVDVTNPGDERYFHALAAHVPELRP